MPDDCSPILVCILKVKILIPGELIISAMNSIVDVIEMRNLIYNTIIAIITMSGTMFANITIWYSQLKVTS